MSKKDLAANLFVRSGLAQVALAARALTKPQFPILAYHRILNVSDENSYPYDAELISATTSGFRRQMEFVRNHFTPIKLETFSQWAQGKADLPKNPIAITFDDGYRDNFTNAMPILKELDMVGTFFVTTDYATNGRIYWFDYIYYLASTCWKEGPLKLPAISFETEYSSNQQNRIQVAKTLVKKLAGSTESARLNALRELETAFPGSWEQASCGNHKSMSWDEIRRANDAGFEIGSHTCSHRSLSVADLEATRNELANSKKLLEEQLNAPVTTISYPFGHYNKEWLAEVERSGYQIACTYTSGNNDIQRDELFELRRIHVERYSTDTMFRSLLTLPKIFT